MGGDAVELVVRFAGTLHAVTRVERGDRYVIGTAREVDLPSTIATSFTLIESVANGFLLRVPLGVKAKSERRYVEGAFVLARGQRIEMTIGLVAISIRHVVEAVTPVPRPPVQRGLVPFFALTLVAHVALVATAMATAPIEPITIPVVLAKPPPRVLPKTVPVKPPKPKPEKRHAKAKQAQQAAAAAPPSESNPGGAQTPAEQHRAAVQAVRDGAYFGGITKEQIAALTGSKNLAQELADVGPIWDAVEAERQGFGGAGGAFDPTKDPAFDSVKVGPVVIKGNFGTGYKLPAHGNFREVGTPPIMGLTCDDAACTTVGELDRLAVRDYVEKKYVDMLKCYERHGRREKRIEVTLKFEITSDGRAAEVSGGESAFGQCLEKLVEKTKFPREKPTQVTAYTIAFWRTTAG
jgi:hypothetical protein